MVVFPISLGPGSAVGEKGEKLGSNRKNIGERGELSGAIGCDLSDFFLPPSFHYIKVKCFN